MKLEYTRNQWDSEWGAWVAPVCISTTDRFISIDAKKLSKYQLLDALIIMIREVGR